MTDTNDPLNRDLSGIPGSSADFPSIVTEDHHATFGVGAILRVGTSHVLMQLRDADKPIWFPDHWGLFGGALEEGESADMAIAREIEEEIGLTGLSFRYLTQVAFDVRPWSGGVRGRSIFVADLEDEMVEAARTNLREGADCRPLPLDGLLSGGYRVTPYDAFALSLYAVRAHLAEAALRP